MTQVAPASPRPDGKGFALSITTFPEGLHPLLKQIDDEGNGMLEMDEITEVFQSYADMKQAQKSGSIPISMLPKELRPQLKVFDSDGDGTVAPLELARGAELYVESKKQAKRLIKLVGALLLLMGLMLGAITGLVFSVVELSKETSTSSDGRTTVKGKDAVTMGGTVDALHVFDADKTVFAKLVEGTTLLRDRPKAITVEFIDGQFMTFPPEFINVGKTSATVRNVPLGIRLTLEQGKPAQFQHDTKGSAIAGLAVVQVKIYIRQGATDIKLDSHAADKAKARRRLLEDVSGEYSMPMTPDQADSENAAQASQDAKGGCRFTIEDMSDSQLRTVEGSANQGPPSSWIVLFQTDVETGDITLFCEQAKATSGLCGPLPSTTIMASTSGIMLSITRENLRALQTSLMANCQIANAVAYVSKDLSMSAPAYHEVSHTDPMQHERHAQMRSAVHNTPEGAKHVNTKNAEALLKHEQDVMADPDRRRSLLGITKAGDVKGLDCYVGVGQSYRGSVNTVHSGEPCMKWKDVIGADTGPSWYAGKVSDANAAKYGIDGDDNNNCRHPGTDDSDVSPLAQYGFNTPFCVFSTGNGGVSAKNCDVPSCLDIPIDPSSGYYKKDATWGLKRIGQSGEHVDLEKANPTYNVNGNGVYVFVFDTGVNTDHTEFAGRVADQTFDCTDDVEKNQMKKGQDAGGHGTHVAGTILGKTHGIAPGATVVNVKVLGKNGGNGAWISQCIDKVIAYWESKGKPPASACGSLVGGFSAYSNANWKRMWDAGIFAAVAAGNEDQDACQSSPASEESVMTVGATNIDDTKAMYSNWGRCVQIFAPGTGIVAAKHDTNDKFTSLQGTSMATPFVAGAAALYLEANPKASPDTVKKFLLETALKDQVHAMTLTLFKDDTLPYSLKNYLNGATDKDAAGKYSHTAGDEAKNVADTGDGTVLLHMPGNVNTGPKDCTGTDGFVELFSDWTWDADCPAQGAKIFTGEYAEADTAKKLRLPSRKGTRKCLSAEKGFTAKTCFCTSAIEREESCNPTGTKYEYFTTPEWPSMALKDADDIKALVGSIFTYSPKSGPGYAITKSAMDSPDGVSFVLPHAAYASDWFEVGQYVGDDGCTKLSLPGDGFKIGGETFTKVWVCANGYVAFEKGTGIAYDGKMTSHFDTSRGKYAISLLFADLNVAARGKIHFDYWSGPKTGNKPVAVLTYAGVPNYVGGGYSEVEASPLANTVQLIMHCDGSGTFQIAYKSIMPSLLGHAVVGVAKGQDKPADYVAKIKPNFDFAAQKPGPTLKEFWPNPLLAYKRRRGSM